MQRDHDAAQAGRAQREAGLASAAARAAREEREREAAASPRSANVLNAKHHSREAEIVAEAGNPGTVTIATQNFDGVVAPEGTAGLLRQLRSVFARAWELWAGGEQGEYQLPVETVRGRRGGEGLPVQLEGVAG